jgi:ABC-type multidrug transport system permease subunit
VRRSAGFERILRIAALALPMAQDTIDNARLYNEGDDAHAGATFGVLITLHYFPSGAVYPINGLPGWMRTISSVDPFTHAVHALKVLLLKNAGDDSIAFDLLFLLGSALVMMTAATLPFKRSP